MFEKSGEVLINHRLLHNLSLSPFFIFFGSRFGAIKTVDLEKTIISAAKKPPLPAARKIHINE